MICQPFSLPLRWEGISRHSSHSTVLGSLGLLLADVGQWKEKRALAAGLNTAMNVKSIHPGVLTSLDCLYAHEQIQDSGGPESTKERKLNTSKRCLTLSLSLSLSLSSLRNRNATVGSWPLTGDRNKNGVSNLRCYQVCSSHDSAVLSCLWGPPHTPCHQTVQHQHSSRHLGISRLPPFPSRLAQARGKPVPH